VMVMLVWHTEITMRHKDKAILYWFGPPESKTLHPVLRFVLLALRDYMTTCPREDALARCCGGGGYPKIWKGSPNTSTEEKV
jgi:hypothetical protein